MKNKLIYLGLPLAIALIINNNNRNKNIARNESNAETLGWGSLYDNENPYEPPEDLIKYDKEKNKYIGLKYDLIFDGEEYSEIRREKNGSILNAVGNLKLITHIRYSSKVLNLNKDDVITGIQFRIATGWLGVANEPSGNREWSTPSNFESDDYQIYLGNSKKKIQLKKNYESNVNQTEDFKLVKKGVQWEDKEWPFGKVPLNNFGPILKFDKEFIYKGGDILLEINYPNKTSTEIVNTEAQAFKQINSDLGQSTFFDYKFKSNVLPLKDFILDVQFEIKKNNICEN